LTIWITHFPSHFRVVLIIDRPRAGTPVVVFQLCGSRSIHKTPTIVPLPAPADSDKPLPALPEPLVQQEEDIESNPISFFLTTPSDDFLSLDDEIDFFNEQDDFYADVFDDDEDLSAGIEGSEEDLRSKEVGVREVSPSSLQRQRKEEEEKLAVEEQKAEVEFGFAMPLSLKEFTARPVTAIDIVPNNTGRVSRAGQRSSPTVDEQLHGLGIELPTFGPRSSTVHLGKDKERGRGRVRLSPSLGGQRSVSWSPPMNRRKPVSWRVPSRSIWRIDEVDEKENWFDGLSSSAPAANSGFGIMKAQTGKKVEEGKKKVVKRVHWADE
jgi:hypothetical protein